ncbi:HAD-IA family hydrolase [Polaribacter staleyi]|uniref:HAD family hydrolase n=1 Tax=Polaribacter staleyi TaxID=2022337 RepID=UPI0031B9E57D
MKKKYLLFDFDGVLAESVNIKTEAFREMYLSHGDEFAQKVVDFHEANGGVSRYEKFKVFNGEWLGERITDEKINELANVFSNLVVDGVVNAPEVTGANDFLESSKEYTKFIITGTPTIEIKPILEQRKMTHFFKESFGSPEKKGHWVKHILKTENISAESCVFIGDAMADYKAAIDNDIDFILRETELAANLFKDYKGYSLKDMTGMHEILNKMNG